MAQMPRFNLIFLGLGWPWVGEFVGFITVFMCFSTQHNLVNRKHPIYSETLLTFPDNGIFYRDSEWAQLIGLSIMLYWSSCFCFAFLGFDMTAKGSRSRLGGGWAERPAVSVTVSMLVTVTETDGDRDGYRDGDGDRDGYRDVTVTVIGMVMVTLTGIVTVTMLVTVIVTVTAAVAVTVTATVADIVAVTVVVAVAVTVTAAV